MTGNVLVVAFDGLDYDRIQEYGCEAVVQEEFGRIDNQTGIDHIITYELFASFLTGQPSSDHCINKFYPEDEKQPWVWRWHNRLDQFSVFKKWSGLRRAVLESLGYEPRPALKQFLDHETLFDTIDDSEAMFVPVECVGLRDSFWDILESDYHDLGDVEDKLNKEHLWRKTQFFDELDQHQRQLLMVHFFKPDHWQHVYGDPHGNMDENKLRAMYREMDELAAKIVDAADQYEYVVFMSDHGLPTENGHNENAFYSCNRALFGEETPAITDFHGKILRLVGEYGQ